MLYSVGKVPDQFSLIANLQVSIVQSVDVMTLLGNDRPLVVLLEMNRLFLLVCTLDEDSFLILTCNRQGALEKHRAHAQYAADMIQKIMDVRTSWNGY